MSFQVDQSLAKSPDRDGIDPAGPNYDQLLAVELQRRLKKASMIQEELGGSREELLIERERFRLLGKSLRDQRAKAGDTEAKLMSALRRFFNDRRHELPPYLNAAYDEVEAERDKLGAMDEDYLQLERTLSGSEWTFMDKESDVYQFELQELFTDLFNINTPSQIESQPHAQSTSALPNNELQNTTFDLEGDYQNARAEHDDFRKQFDHLRVEQSESFDLYDLPRVRNAEEIAGPASNPELPSRSSELLGNLIASEVKVERLKQQKLLHNNIPLFLDRRMSDPLKFRDSLLPPVDNLSRAQTESAVSTLFDDPATLLKISEWLLDYLEKNRIVNHSDESQEYASQYRTTDLREQARLSERTIEPSMNNLLPGTSATSIEVPNSGYNNEIPWSNQSMTVTAPSHDGEPVRQERPFSPDQSKLPDTTNTPPLLFPPMPPKEPLKQFPVCVPNPIFQTVTYSPARIILDDMKPQYGLDHLALPCQDVFPTNPLSQIHVTAARMERREDSMEPYQRTAVARKPASPQTSPRRATLILKPQRDLDSSADEGPVPISDSSGFLFVGTSFPYFPKSRSERTSLHFHTRDRLRLGGHSRTQSMPPMFCTQYMSE